jgi:AraC-like DNA-binding protein
MYCKDSLRYNTHSITLIKPYVFSKAYTKISWNEKYLLFHVEVNNSLFYSTLPAEILEKIGVTIHLDPANSKKPYISEEIACFKIPVNHEPYQIKKIPSYNPDGTFEYKDTILPCKFNKSVIMENFKGYTIDFYIPQKFFGMSLPEMIGFNIIAAVIDEKSNVKELSWIQGSDDFITSPFTYGKLIILKKPFLANPFLLWFLSFAIGILLGISGIYIRKLAKRYNPLVKFEDSEFEEQLIKNIDIIFEAEIINHNFNINDISSKLKISRQKVNAIVKKHYGRTFKNHLLFCRVEIVKERLRSSNASESAIAKSCGFESVNEMEKQFHHFNGTSPYNFRINNRIT